LYTCLNCIVQLLLELVANLVMVKRIECELKFESKDIFVVTFQQNKPLAIKPYMSRGLVIFQSPAG
jgi:hypothetical protein